MSTPTLVKTVHAHHIHSILFVLILSLGFQYPIVAQDDRPCDCFESLEEPVLLSELYCDDKMKSIQESRKKMTQLIYRNMDYPPQARRNKISGSVIIEYQISTKGKAFDFRIVSDPLGSGLEEEALNATKNIEGLSFYPAQKDCNPTHLITRDTVTFRLH